MSWGGLSQELAKFPEFQPPHYLPYALLTSASKGVLAAGAKAAVNAASRAPVAGGVWQVGTEVALGTLPISIVWGQTRVANTQHASEVGHVAAEVLATSGVAAFMGRPPSDGAYAVPAEIVFDLLMWGPALYIKNDYWPL